ncbi:flagellar hook assembly protein FlgD [Oceanospirillum sediminis]|uniref:Basal-body rod modification protein FlgD n=1 Tax=Oceanospirillum sediminis TaxID=2760088 RepID=A0A839IJV5_9GAMM|nr:flagellar hook assembly protein FlgD [Oceanospirillum sediminis]MBB1485623.1 flagellar hook assembly protein FlgD [Oceanospirillum sediminis]
MANISIDPNSDFYKAYSVEGKQAAAEATNKAKNDPNAMGQTEFLELMMAQLENQDPLSPQNNTEFIAQLAQFSSVEGIQSLNNNVNGLVDSFKSSQALQASALVGRKVQIEGSSALAKQGEGLSGSVEIPSGASDMLVVVKDASGQGVKELNLSEYMSDTGSYPAGKVPFEWDGTDNEGNALPAGTYSVSATAVVNGNSQVLGTNVNVNVDSVTMGTAGQITLNLAGYGSMSLEDVKEFH